MGGGEGHGDIQQEGGNAEGCLCEGHAPEEVCRAVEQWVEVGCAGRHAPQEGDGGCGGEAEHTMVELHLTRER